MKGTENGDIKFITSTAKDYGMKYEDVLSVFNNTETSADFYEALETYISQETKCLKCGDTGTKEGDPSSPQGYRCDCSD